MINYNGIEIDTEKAECMLQRIIKEETNNVKAKEFNDGEMSKKLKGIIEEEANCL
jgi:hypothetical protein